MSNFPNANNEDDDNAISYKSSIDPYGFEHPDGFDYKSYEDFMSDYLVVLARRARKWQMLMGSGKQDIVRGRKAKRYIRKGIPREHRGQIWMISSGAQEMMKQNPDLYRNLSNEELKKDVLDSIILDIPRTFPDNIYFKNNGYAKPKSLLNVLSAFAKYCPDVGYCQGLNFIAGILLLVTESEEQSFFLLIKIATEIAPYYTCGMEGLLCDIDVLSLLVKAKAPAIYNHLERCQVSWPILVTKWLICLYAEVLPIETVLRIWDCLFHEGSKILFRVALTLVMKHEHEILKATCLPDACNVFKSMVSGDLVTDCHFFMQAIFRTPGNLPRALIAKFRTTIQEQKQKR